MVDNNHWIQNKKISDFIKQSIQKNKATNCYLWSIACDSTSSPCQFSYFIYHLGNCLNEMIEGMELLYTCSLPPQPFHFFLCYYHGSHISTKTRHVSAPKERRKVIWEMWESLPIICFIHLALAFYFSSKKTIIKFVLSYSADWVLQQKNNFPLHQQFFSKGGYLSKWHFTYT